MCDPDCPMMPGAPCMRRAEDDGSAWGRCRWCDRAVDYDPGVFDLVRVRRADRLADAAAAAGVDPERTPDYIGEMG